MRPLIIEFIARMPIVRFFVRLGRGVVIPDFETSINQYKIKKAEHAVDLVIHGLAAGDHFVVFPSGKFKNQAREELGGSSSVHTILQKVPDVHIVLVRFSGLWGSRFSKALTGKSPSLIQQAVEGVKIVCKNLLFFTPRRKVYVEFVADLPNFPRSHSKIEINRFLENWYNQYVDDEGNIHKEEPLKLVPNYFWSKKLPKMAMAHSKKKGFSSTQSKKVEEAIYREIRKILDRPNLKVSPELSLGEDLGMDSLNIAEMVAYLFKVYSIQEVSFTELRNVQDLIDLAAKAGEEKKNIVDTPFKWPEETNRPSPSLCEGKTLPEAFFNICQKMGSLAALGDDVSGVLSYKRCKKGVLVLAEAFRNIPEKNVGIILPSSIGATLVIMALLCAGKVPVPLNWTLGPKYLESMMSTAGFNRVISSWRFMEKVNFVDFGALADRMELLEDIKTGLTLKMKSKGLFHSILSPKKVLKKLGIAQESEDQPCVILFTSGTEAAPKGVPLSHKNVLSTIGNCYGVLQRACEPNDVLYAVLPQFHSFGFTNSTFTPLLCGMKTAFNPNPTDSFSLAHGIEKWKITFLPIIPNFLKKLFAVANPEELKTLRVIITAGEKTPVELFEKVASLQTGTILIEGYGLSETSPVVAMMHLGSEPKGVGQILPNIEVLTIHPETHLPLLKGEAGEICLRGPNVFQGYLGNTSSPFIDIGGKSWFRTGDIGYVDSENHLILTDRLKRFVKLAGEMISLGAIEEALHAECRKRGLSSIETPSLAICSDQQNEGSPKLILFSIFPIDLELANQLLKEVGFSNLIKISKVNKIEEIPLTSTGKINYRALSSL